jgi:hypothetical protein
MSVAKATELSVAGGIFIDEKRRGSEADCGEVACFVPCRWLEVLDELVENILKEEERMV